MNEVVYPLGRRTQQVKPRAARPSTLMAGCRPEYMPVLLAIVEVMADPDYGLKHGGSTPGWEAMIILNGPIREELGLNDKLGVQRPGNQANTSMGRFYRLFARNIPRFLPGTTDMATFGQMFRAVVAENEEACAEIGWNPLHVVRGYKPEDTIRNYLRLCDARNAACARRTRLACKDPSLGV